MLLVVTVVAMSLLVEIIKVKETSLLTFGNRRAKSSKGNKAVIVYGVVSKQGLHLTLVRPQGPPLTTVVKEANQQTLKIELEKFRNSLAKPISNPSTYLPQAQKLYHWLISPLESELETLDKSEVLAMGADSFAHHNLDDLPAVPTELNSIAGKMWPGESFLNEYFTLSNLRNQRSEKGFGIIHLATHASFSTTANKNPYIQFWDKKVGLDGLRDARWYHGKMVQLLTLREILLFSSKKINYS
ncbi:MAG: CHAT domain-containing protein [Spirulinaceae cyanobacterium]